MTIVDIQEEINRLETAICNARERKDHVEICRLENQLATLKQLLVNKPMAVPKKTVVKSHEGVSINAMMKRYQKQLGITCLESETKVELLADSCEAPVVTKGGSSYQELVSLLSTFQKQRAALSLLDDKVAKLVEDHLPEEEFKVDTSSECPSDYKQMLITADDKTTILDFYDKLVAMKCELEFKL